MTLLSGSRESSGKVRVPAFPITVPSRIKVLQELFLSEPKSRADIARATDLTKVTVSDAVEALRGMGLIEELESEREARPGKPSTPIRIRPDSFAVLGVDLSDADHWSFSWVGLDGGLLSVETVDRRGAKGDQFLTELAKTLRTAIDSAPYPVMGVGVGSPGVISRDGVVLEATNLGWHDLPVRDILHDALGVPVVVENDAHLAALAERTFRTSRDYSLIVRIAEGVGAGLVVEGTVPSGSANAAGELGHTVVVEGGNPCGCGKRGCLEAYLAAPVVERRIDETSVEEALSVAGDMLGAAVAPIVGLLNLRSVVISAPDLYRHELFLSRTSAAIADRTLPRSHQDLSVEFSDFAHDIVLRGAAGRVMSELLGLV